MTIDDRKLDAARKWKAAREEHNKAFLESDGARSTGMMMTASRIADEYRADFGLRTTDEAVAEMRELLKRQKK